MRKKPDLLWILAILLGVGIVTTGYTQSFWERSNSETPPSSLTIQAISAPHTSVDQ